MALALRRAERAGRIDAPPELRELVRRSGWPDEQIDAAFLALADVELSPFGEFLVVVSRLDARKTAALKNENLIQLSIPDWSLTHKGTQMWALMGAYADPRLQWRS